MMKGKQTFQFRLKMTAKAGDIDDVYSRGVSESIKCA